jgi:hypothetical protein
MKNKKNNLKDFFNQISDIKVQQNSKIEYPKVICTMPLSALEEKYKESKIQTLIPTIQSGLTVSYHFNDNECYDYFFISLTAQSPHNGEGAF